ncbi:MAG: hypothetical protein NT085_01965 [candidate division SR1 bacterium]|nr:hypothetical protein [candidate division SR1 bacterium]
MKNILTDQEQKERFDRAGNDSKNRFRKTRALHFSAKKLFDIYRKAVDETIKMKSGVTGKATNAMYIIDQVILLEGFAIECLLKGLYVCDGNKIVENGKLIKTSHNLLRRCELTKIEVDKGDKERLEILSLAIISYGRYPIANKYEKNPLIRTIKFGYKPTYIRHYDYMIQIENFIIGILGDDE